MNIRSGTILMYNCSGPEFSKLRQIFAMLRMRMHPVTPDRYHISLIDLANGKGEPAETAEAPLEEAMLVFCGVRQPLLNQVLEVIRLAKLPPIPLKAVLTVGNQEWDSLKLHEELLKEREAMEQARKAAQEERAKQQNGETAEADKPAETAEAEVPAESTETPAQTESDKTAE